jgi:hypothetical protein
LTTHHINNKVNTQNKTHTTQHYTHKASNHPVNHSSHTDQGASQLGSSLSTTFIKTTCKGQAWVGSKHDFAGNSWWHMKQVEQGSMDMTQSMKHQVEGQIMQEKE